MLKNRIIPCLDVKNGRVVKGINFVDLKDAGDPVEQAKIYSDGGADEICFLDITASNENRDTIYDVVEKTSKKCFVPLTVGGGIRSLNVALRQKLDLFACVRPVRWYEGTPSPVKNPDFVDMIIFRENSEDVYAGIEWEAGSPEVKKVIDFLQDEMGVSKIRFPKTSGIGIKPISREGTSRIVRAAINYAIDNDKPSVTIVHKGNIMKFTEGGFRDWGYQLAKDEFGATELDGGPWCTMNNPKTNNQIIIKSSKNITNDSLKVSFSKENVFLFNKDKNRIR